MKRVVLSALFAAAALAGCRGQPSKDPPIHLFGDMDWQEKYQPQEMNPFFQDKRAMRPLVEGTVAQGQLLEDDTFYRGKVGNNYVAVAPGETNEGRLRRGQERFNIYCSPCHDRTGSGKGMVVQRGFPPPVDLASDRVIGMPDGEIFNVISHGVRNMPSYGAQIPESDRWAIVTWVRVIQRSQHATIDDVPAEFRGNIEPEGGAK